MRLTTGDRLPEFKLMDQEGQERSSMNLNGKALVLFFYPKDDTPGCTAEACSFRDSYSRLKELGAEVWGVSGDNIQNHQRFASRYNLPFPLLSDTGNNLREIIGVPKTLGFIPGRVTYIVDKEGIIRDIFNNLLDASSHVIKAEKVLLQLAQNNI